MVRLLLEKGPDINAMDLCRKTALHWAAKNRHMAVPLENGAHDDTKATYGKPELYRAAGNGHEGAVRRRS